MRLFVPEADDSAQRVEETAETFSGLFGGATSYKAVGYWQSDVDGLVREHVTIVEAFCDTDAVNREIDSVLDTAEQLKLSMKQEAVAVEINNKLYLV